jgi:sRNA-binding carbon storage regulator CsrA
MLVLSRHKDQVVDLFIAGVKVAHVTVVDIRDGNKVRLGFDGGPEILFLRRELTTSCQDPRDDRRPAP